MKQKTRLQEMKKECHHVFDHFWKGDLDKIPEKYRRKNKKKSNKKRGQLYRKLADELEISISECHFKNLDINMLNKAYTIIRSWDLPIVHYYEQKKYQYPFGNNKEIFNHNSSLVMEFKGKHTEEIIELDITDIDLTYPIHVSEWTKWYKKHKDITRKKMTKQNTKSVIVQKRESGTYRLLMGYAGYLHTYMYGESKIKAIIYNGSLSDFKKELGWIKEYDVIKIEKIKVPYYFKDAKVYPEKLELIEKYFAKHKCLDMPMTLEDGFIVDGYEQYMFACNIGLKIVEFVYAKKKNEVVA